MPVFFQKATNPTVEVTQESPYHIHIDVEVDVEDGRIPIEDMAELRRKFGEEAATMTSGGKVWVLNRDLHWDEAEPPTVLGLLVEE